MKGELIQLGLIEFSTRIPLIRPKATVKFLAILVMLCTWSIAASAEPTTQSNRPVTNSTSTSSQEVDTSLSRDYDIATIYLPDPQTQQLMPQAIQVAADQPIASAVSQIIQAYRGQDIGIKGYEVKVNPRTREAQVNFDIENPLGTVAFQSLSSTSQLALFEAIRETLLTLPSYNIKEVKFSADGSAFDI